MNQLIIFHQWAMGKWFLCELQTTVLTLLHACAKTHVMCLKEWDIQICCEQQTNCSEIWICFKKNLLPDLSIVACLTIISFLVKMLRSRTLKSHSPCTSSSWPPPSDREHKRYSSVIPYLRWYLAFKWLYFSLEFHPHLDERGVTLGFYQSFNKIIPTTG